MKKTVLTISTVAVVGLTGSFFGSTVNAQKSMSDIKDQRAEIKVNLSDAEQKIADVLVELEELNKMIARVDYALGENNKQMKETEDKITGTKKEVEKLEAEIVKLEKEIQERYEIMKDRVASYQKNGGSIGFLEVIFGSESFGDFISRVSAISTITESDANLMEEQEKAKAKVEEKQNTVQNKLDELKDMKAELEEMQSVIVEQKKQNEAAKKELKEKEQRLKSLKANLQSKDSNLAALETEIQRGMTAANNGLNSTSSSSGSRKSSSSYSAPSAPASKVSGNISTVINAGYKYIGNSVYVFGGGRTASDIRNGIFDCSGFIAWAFSQGGISVPASTSQLQYVGKRVSINEIQPGDLVFYNTYKPNGHVGIYIGNGKFIGSQSSTGVAIVDMDTNWWSSRFSGLVRRVR
ncbi:coiled-coil domain-containing protein [Virgibacillus oceani]|uniref:Peptidase P60 n=1 Tax=Virgibacillus oceani TaxID=1479511 RepID=A0A917GYA5_9BACI|nr:C40 family peptidase [Virgibacillus oceani]GGG61108.1 peptidase P60 [Virgibacillus oceani]